MDDRLKGLRQSMKKTAFKGLEFSEQHRKQIHAKIKQIDEETIMLTILQLLANEKTGYELTQFLHVRGMQQFKDNEGSLYTILHRLEQSRVITSTFDDKGDKFYQINEKGRKLVRKAEKTSSAFGGSLKKWIEG